MHFSFEQSEEGSGTYNSDAWNRLTKITYPDGKITEYTYDAAGNRLTVVNNNGTTVYTYGSDNQLLTVTRPDGTTVNYAYNSNGDVAEITDGSGTTKFDYDGEGRLVTVTLPDNSTVTFAYDAEGHRVSRTTSAGTVKYVYDGDRLAAETDASGNIIATYVFDDSDMPVSMTRGGVTYYYLYDGHGDVIALIDQAGNVAASYEYDEWDNVIAETGQVENPFRYAGYFYDEELKLYFLKSRYYDPSTGRFLSKDKARGVDENPYNEYKYCNDDPVNFVDPTGHFATVGEFPSRSWFDGIPYKWRRDARARLQNDLNAWGYLGRNGLRLVVDGIYGPNTRFAHESYFLARYTAPSLGIYFEPVPLRKFQLGLKLSGFDPGPIDGLYGPRTRIANEHYLDSIGKTPADLTRFSARYIPTKRKSYVFYNPDNFSWQASVEAKELTSRYNSITEMIAIKTKNEFIEAWNRMDYGGYVICGVSLLFHGTPWTINIDYQSEEYLTTKTNGKTPKGHKAIYIGKLSRKIIDRLHLMSCNSGHLDVPDNLEATFRKVFGSSIHRIIGWDGSLSYNRDGTPRLASPWSQEDFIKYCCNGFRNPRGPVLY